MQTGKMRGKRNRHHTTQPVPGTARAEALEIRAGVFRQPAMQTPVLVLNASYEPINICGARRALVLVLKGVARTEEEQGAMLHSARMSDAPMPSVIRLLEYRRIPHQTRALSARTSCCATATPASIAEPVLTCRRTDAGPRDSALAWRASPPGRTSSPAATSAIAARAITCCMSSMT